MIGETVSAPAVLGVAYAEANFGRWISRCPAPWCTNALALDRGQSRFVCAGPDSCGTVAELSWPADPDAVEAILAMRPIIGTRNWLPGETLAELIGENAAHGVVPPEWSELAAAAGGQLEILATEDERVVGGLLFHHLEAAGLRREIGA
jgi:hypothetical protein